MTTITVEATATSFHAVKDNLLADGWQIVELDGNKAEYRHDKVLHEQAARERLMKLGYLTAAYLRINFNSGRRAGV